MLFREYSELSKVLRTFYRRQISVQQDIKLQVVVGLYLLWCSCSAFAKRRRVCSNIISLLPYWIFYRIYSCTLSLRHKIPAVT